MRSGLFIWVCVAFSAVVLAFIAIPLLNIATSPSPSIIWESLHDGEIMKAVLLSLYTSGMAAVICLLLGTPLAYLLARREFAGKNLVESIVDIPIVIPHPVVGIAILAVTGRNHWMGRFLADLGVRIMGSPAGIITVLVFVSIPFFVNAAKEGFAAVPERLEKVSMTLGASRLSTFGRVTFPLAGRSVLTGTIMSAARALSEFGAVVVVAYHPMIAPVLMFERYQAYGLKYSQPVAFILIAMSLAIFIILRVLSSRKRTAS
ncbi:MAG: ABC transporter permease [Candidatus Fermentibacteraceae bacterium]|nr:ABC transporter permease [Candidatus Fermentibacteraceae bacterium]